MTRLRKIGARFTAPSPRWQGIIATAALYLAWSIVVLVTPVVDVVVPFDGWVGTVGGFMFGVLSGAIIARVGLHVMHVAQIRREMAADAEAMRPAIERFERGER